MKVIFQRVLPGMILIFTIAFEMRADRVEMRNGDNYFGKVVSMSAEAVVLDSEVLGKITVPRTSVAGLAFGTNAAAPVSIPTNQPATPTLAALMKTNAELSTLLRGPGTNAVSISEIRTRMLAGNPEALGKFNEMASGLMSGKLSVDDIRREAKSAAEQLRELKHELGPEAAGSFDGYLGLLDDFLKETSPATTNARPAPQLKSAVH